MSMGVDASIGWLWTSGIIVSGNVGGGFTEGGATIAAGDAYESEVDAGVLSRTRCSSGPPWRAHRAWRVACHHPAGDASGGSPRDHSHPSRRRPHWWAHRLRHHASLPGPHHTISEVGAIGGGQRPLPGEGSLAHHGILLLDERPACTRHILEVLRQPLEKRIISSQPHGCPRSGHAGRTSNTPGGGD